MITVKFLGGAKKTFSADIINIEEEDLTIHGLLDLLMKKKSLKNPNPEVSNLLVAVNGVDSSAMNGYDTKLKNGDVISIIPIIHGGAPQRIQFKIEKLNIELFELKQNQSKNLKFLDNLREKFPNLIIQAISSRYLLSVSHAQKIISISLYAKKNKTMLSKKIETDILLRFAGTTQINTALDLVGINNAKNIVILAIGKKSKLDELFSELSSQLNPNPISKTNANFLKKKFNITTKHLNSINSNLPLEDLLVEKAAVLF